MNSIERFYATAERRSVDRPACWLGMPTPSAIPGLCEHFGVKTFEELKANCGDDFYVWSGNDDQVVPMMSLGAKGVISVVSNLAPELMTRMTHLCLEGKFQEAAALQLGYMDFIDALFLEVNPIPIKAAMNLAGYDIGSLRLPLCDMSDGPLETLRQSMVKAGLLSA